MEIATAEKKAKEPAHNEMSWTGCYDDSCVIHFMDKSGAG
jgi:hypothetical protein